MKHRFTKQWRVALGLGLAATLGTALCPALPASAHDAPSLDPYRPEAQVSGLLRSWGADPMQKLMTEWQRGFSRVQPDIRFEDHLINTALAMPGLAADAADLGLTGRQAYRNEVVAYLRFHGHLPFIVEVATGAFNASGKKSFPPVVFVNRDNPIAQLTLAQLDGIFGAERSGGWDYSGTVWRTAAARGPERNLRRWGELGLEGVWKDRTIQPYGFVVGPRSGVAHFFAERVFEGGDTWNENLREIWFEPQPDGSVKDLNTAIVDAVGRDRNGIGYGASQYLTPAVKTVALARNSDGPFVQASGETIADRTFPFARPIYIVVNRKPGQPLDPKVREFLRYVLSRNGQQALRDQGEYLPLPADLAWAQLKRLD